MEVGSSLQTSLRETTFADVLTWLEGAKELKIREGLHIFTTPTDRCLNRNEDLELPGCWTATMKWIGGEASSALATVSRTHVSSQDAARL